MVDERRFLAEALVAGVRATRGEPAALRRVDEIGWTSGIVSSRVWLGSSSLGMLRISDFVYGIFMSANSSRVGAFSTSLPPYITAISSVWPATTPRSWVTRITDMLRSLRCSPISSRIWACTVTSRAVVGSSANSRVGPQASAMAIITRWRMPPDSSWGYWPSRRSGSGMRTSRSSRSAVSPRCALVHPEVESEWFGDLLADLHQRVERDHRVLEHHRHLGAPQVAHLLGIESEDLLAGEPDRTRRHSSRGQQAHDRAAQHGLARTRFADDPERLAALERERDTVDGPDEAALGTEVGLEVGDLEQRAFADAALGLEMHVHRAASLTSK